VIGERLPTVSFKTGEMFLNWKDPVTGAAYSRTFDLKGEYLVPGYVEDVLFNYPWGSTNHNPFTNRNVSPTDASLNRETALDSRNFFADIASQFSDAVFASGAIAPLWEVQTAAAQRARGDACFTPKLIAIKHHETFRKRDLSLQSANEFAWKVAA
jgi:hypothetical protein